MKILSTVLALAALTAANATWAACTYPTAPEKFPDGSTASKEEMLASQKQVKEYQAQITTYTECLKTEHDAQVSKIDPALDQAQKDAQKDNLDKILAQKNDAAVDAAQTVAEHFNTQIHAYNDKHKKS